jgi:OPA family glycerol-3-phosphate transporter-like MFS transporter
VEIEDVLKYLKQAQKRNPGFLSWQRRIFGTIWITYFMFYFCRTNMPVTKSTLADTFSWSAAEIGMIFSALTLMYALGQFINGQLADRFGTRIIVTIGCAGSVLMNLAVFGVLAAARPNSISTSVILKLLIFFWGINGFFQAMGWSPMVKAMTHWFPLKTRGKTMGWLGTSYQLGAAFGQLLALFLLSTWVSRFSGDWRMVFVVPALLFAGTGIFFYFSFRNYPQDVGLPPVDEHLTVSAAQKIHKPRSVGKNIAATLGNPHIWIVAIVFFLLDVNRYGFVNWLPAYIMETQTPSGADVSVAFLKNAIKLGIHPAAGSLGVIICGWATDRFFQGRRAPVIALALLTLGIFSIILPLVDAANTTTVVTVVALIGFFTYGAHILMVGHAAQDFGRKQGAAGAAGFIDGMGYIGASLAGWGAGRLIDLKSYSYTFKTAGICALIGAALICILWKMKPQGG